MFGKEFEQLNAKEKAALQLQEETRGKSNGWGEIEYFMRHLAPKDHALPLQGFNFQLTDNLLLFCVEQKFMEEEHSYANCFEGKEYLNDNISKIVEDLKNTQLWRTEGNQFILDFNKDKGIVLIGINNKEVKIYDPIKYTEEQMLTDKDSRLLAIKKSEFNSKIGYNLQYFLNKSKIKNLEFNSQFQDYVSKKFFGKDDTAVETFIYDRFQTIIKACEGFKDAKGLVIHYDERVGTVVKNENGKYLLRLPEEEQLAKMRNNIDNSSKSKIMQNKL